jgi:protein-arginine kinase activator protein McsA
MTEKEMNDFADLLAEKVFKLIMDKQAELDQQFIEQVKASGQDIEITLQQDVFGNGRNATEEEQLLAEMARLMTLLDAYEAKEQYEKAAIIKSKIDRIENKLNKL